MDAVLRQSKAMCPFLKQASPATLRALSTSTRPQVSPCGGTISKLQLLGQRCPVMGKALAIQSARVGKTGMARTATTATTATTVTGLRNYSGQSKGGKAKIHTSRHREARAVDSPVLNRKFQGAELRTHTHTC